MIQLIRDNGFEAYIPVEDVDDYLDKYNSAYTIGEPIEDDDRELYNWIQY